MFVMSHESKTAPS